MLKHILGYSLLFVLAAGGLYGQHRQIISLSVDNKILSGNIEALEGLRKDDQKRVNQYAAQVTKIKNEREKLDSEMGAIRNEKTIDFLDLPIPDELRDIAESYLNGNRKAADNQN